MVFDNKQFICFLGLMRCPSEALTIKLALEYTAMLLVVALKALTLLSVFV